MISFSRRSCRSYSLLELSGDDALDKAELESFYPFDFEGALLDVCQRSAPEVLAGHRYGEDFECSLDAACNARRAGHVVDQNQSAARP